MIELFLLMVFGHALADYPLQGDFLARGKNHKQPIPGVPWGHPLAAHCAIHAGFVGIITGSIIIAIGEIFLHAIIDHAKCDGLIGYHTDQAMHILCKALWAVVTVYWVTA